MKRLASAISVPALALCILAMAGPAVSADSACPDGYALTAGGVSEADADGDGLTCERSTAGDEATWLVALDNRASGPPSPCPPAFMPVYGYPRGEDPDRNDNGVVCVRDQTTGHATPIVIDDARRGPSG